MPVSSLIAYNTRVTNTPEPTVGMGVTQILASDQYPYTVVEVVSPKKCIIKPNEYQADFTKSIYQGHQNWFIEEEPNYNMPGLIITKRKNGWWVEKGQTAKHGIRYLIGERRVYYCWEL